MAERVHRIHSLPDDAPWAGGMPPAGSPEHPAAIRALDRVLAIQRPVVVAHLRSIRLRHPTATTSEIVRMLERRYLAAITTGGAAVGATAVIPGIGTGVKLALSGAETVGFLEATALFAQSVAEVHHLPVESPERARALVLALMLGEEGVALVSQLAGQAAGKAPARRVYWGELVTKTIPRAAIGPLVDRLKAMFVRHFAVRGSASVIGKAIPFGIGAAVGGAGNHILGRRVVSAARRAFGVPPLDLPAELEPAPGTKRIEHAAWSGARRASDVVAGATVRATGATAEGAQRATGAAIRGARQAAGAIGAAARGASGLVRRSRRGELAPTPESAAGPAPGPAPDAGPGPIPDPDPRPAPGPDATRP